MKSLLRTCPPTTVTLWGKKVRTNVVQIVQEASADGMRAKDRKLIKAMRDAEGANVLSRLSDLFTEIECHDLTVNAASFLCRGRKILMWVKPDPGVSFTDRKSGKKKNVVSEKDVLEVCGHCTSVFFGSRRELAVSHQRSCPILAVIEVMES